ncbi:signal peptidase II [Nocardioides marmoribigeumensis]|uniref:Lipoprotein signal peptidase n=1 Tax=Nocardioides marmoribigeumensis TaxID=433649 RepID=A0ABU2BRJ9_9ACTN|nr:signal peptidase II [Nocardioides marmoribigeumensis]MDR7361270.1 signal peptidase II [Nocardioides marmoribigeumensis]
MQAARGTPLTPSGHSGPEARDPGVPVTTPSRRRLRLLLALVALAAYSVDVVTKTFAMRHLDGREPVELIGPVLRLTLVRNPGAAFSTGTSSTVALTLLAAAAVVVVLVLARRVGTRGWAVALGLLLGGVSGNLTDRMLRDPAPLRGHVVDFLQLPHWPVFNVADICINLAAALIIWHSWRGVPLRGRRPQTDGSEETGEGAGS